MGRSTRYAIEANHKPAMRKPLSDNQSKQFVEPAAEDDGSENPQSRADKIAADTARYEKLAREHGADLSEEGFNQALKRVVRAKPV